VVGFCRLNKNTKRGLVVAKESASDRRVLLLLTNRKLMVQMTSAYREQKKLDDPVWIFYKLFFKEIDRDMFALDRLPDKKRVAQAARIAWQNVSLHSRAHIRSGLRPEVRTQQANSGMDECDAEIRRRRQRMSATPRRCRAW
jgi:hypothetical protein